MPPEILIDIEETLMQAQNLFLDLQSNGVSREWDDVLNFHENITFSDSRDQVLIKDLDNNHWAGAAAKILPRTSCRFTNTSRSSFVLDNFGQ